jgi:hypothetical protein
MAQRPFDCPPHRMRRHTPCPCRLQVTPGSAASPSRRERAPWPSPGTGEPHVRWLDGGNLRGRVARRPSDARTFRRLPWRSLIRARLRFLSSSSTRCCCAAKLASSSLPLFALPRCLTVFAGGMPARRCNSHTVCHHPVRPGRITTIGWWRTSGGDSRQHSWASTSDGRGVRRCSTAARTAPALPCAANSMPPRRGGRVRGRRPRPCAGARPWDPHHRRLHERANGSTGPQRRWSARATGRTWTRWRFVTAATRTVSDAFLSPPPRRQHRNPSRACLPCSPACAPLAVVDSETPRSSLLMCSGACSNPGSVRRGVRPVGSFSLEDHQPTAQLRASRGRT